MVLRSERVCAPDLLIAECANILWKKVRRKELTEQEALLAARLLQRADIQLEPMRDLIELAARLAIALDHPAYDCIYLALAGAMTADFVTADDVLVRKASSAAIGVNVRPLSSLLPR